MAKKRANGEGNIRKRADGRWEGRYTALLPQPCQPLAVDLDTGGSGSRGVVPEDIAHVVEQPGG